MERWAKVFGAKAAGAKAAGLIVLVAVLAGCTGPHGAAVGSPTPSVFPTASSFASSSSSSPPVIVSAIGPGRQTPQAPAGTRSAVVRFTCASDSTFSISFDGDEMLSRYGACGTTAVFRVGLTYPFGFQVDFPHGDGSYVAEITYSSRPIDSDAKVGAQCSAFTSAYSDIASAQNGYPADLDLAGWNALIAKAASGFPAVGNGGEIGTQMRAMTAWWGSAPPPGPSDSPAASQAERAFQIVNQLCLDNGTPLLITSQYGG